MVARATAWPADAGLVETEWCTTEITDDALKRIAEEALQDMQTFFQQRPEIKRHRLCMVLAEDAANHYVKGTGFRCISVWTFFIKSQACRDFHPLRHTRVDIGTDKFGHSSWKKHPSDIGFTGRGINCYGRSITERDEGDLKATLSHYLKTSKSKGASRLREKAVVLLWPEDRRGEIIWNPVKKRRKADETTP